MGERENWEENAEEQWWTVDWDRGRRMAVFQVLFYVVYAIYVYHVFCCIHNNVPGKSSKGIKREGIMWEREFKVVRGAISDVPERQFGREIL